MFRSRQDGWNKRKPHWVCKRCATTFTERKPRLGADARGPIGCTGCGGRTFHYLASKLEFQRFQELRLLERAGAIKDILIHPRYEVSLPGLRVAVEADFEYLDAVTQEAIIEDVKSPGTDTPISQLKRAILADKQGLVIKLWPEK